MCIRDRSAIDGVAPMKQLSYSWIDRVPAIACTDLGFPRILLDNWLILAFLIYVPARYFTTGIISVWSAYGQLMWQNNDTPYKAILSFEAIDNRTPCALYCAKSNYSINVGGWSIWMVLSARRSGLEQGHQICNPGPACLTLAALGRNQVHSQSKI